VSKVEVKVRVRLPPI